MSFPAYSANFFMSAIYVIFPLLIIISYMFSAITIVRELAFEKERRLRV